MGESLTTVLDFIAVLLLCIGFGWLVTDATNPALGFIAAGLLVLAASLLAAMVRRPPRREEGEGE